MRALAKSISYDYALTNYLITINERAAPCTTLPTSMAGDAHMSMSMSIILLAPCE
jgi:hypothetical protein